MANTSIYNAFERMWQHVVAALGNKSSIGHTHDDLQEAIDTITAGILDPERYGTELPDTGITGQFYFKEVTE